MRPVAAVLVLVCLGAHSRAASVSVHEHSRLRREARLWAGVLEAASVEREVQALGHLLALRTGPTALRPEDMPAAVFLEAASSAGPRPSTAWSEAREWRHVVAKGLLRDVADAEEVQEATLVDDPDVFGAASGAEANEAHSPSPQAAAEARGAEDELVAQLAMRSQAGTLTYEGVLDRAARRATLAAGSLAYDSPDPRCRQTLEACLLGCHRNHSRCERPPERPRTLHEVRTGSRSLMLSA